MGQHGKSRWTTCQATGNLSYSLSWRLVFEHPAITPLGQHSNLLDIGFFDSASHRPAIPATFIDIFPSSGPRGRYTPLGPLKISGGTSSYVPRLVESHAILWLSYLYSGTITTCHKDAASGVVRQIHSRGRVVHEDWEERV